MTVLVDILFASFLAVALSAVFGLLSGRGFRRSGFAWFMLIVFLLTLAGGKWLKPFGPLLWGVAWMPFFAAALFAVLVFALSTPRKPPRGRRETLQMLDRIKKERDLEQFTYVSLTALFWFFLVLLTLAVIYRYALHR